MEPEELEILKRPDGSNWQLGTGAFGVVLKAKRAGVQPVAVKASGVCCLEMHRGGVQQGWAAPAELGEVCNMPCHTAWEEAACHQGLQAFRQVPAGCRNDR